VDHQENENLIVLIPRIVRMPDWTKGNLRAIYSGTETYPGVKRQMDIKDTHGNPNPAAPVAAPEQNPVAPGAIPAAPQQCQRIRQPCRKRRPADRGSILSPRR